LEIDDSIQLDEHRMESKGSGSEGAKERKVLVFGFWVLIY